jgi:hypothetical protein
MQQALQKGVQMRVVGEELCWSAVSSARQLDKKWHRNYVFNKLKKRWRIYAPTVVILFMFLPWTEKKNASYFSLVGNSCRYLFLVSICLLSVIPSAPPLLFPFLPACIIQEDEADNDK